MITNKKFNTDYFVNDCMGGISSLMFNIINSVGNIENNQRLILFDILQNKNNRAIDLPDIEIKNFKFSKNENYYYLSKKFSNFLSSEPGVLISNDVYDLMFSCVTNFNKKIIQFVHDGYNLKLSIIYEKQIDAFVAHNYLFYEMLNQVLHHRKADIFYIPYGIPIHNFEKQINLTEPLKLIFIGRLDQDKGIYDLYEIDEILRKNEIKVLWTIVGNGIEKANMQKQWEAKENIVFKNPATNFEVLQICNEKDVFVFPTKFEGTPVALIEAMSVGCVPVMSNLHQGIRSIVNKENGILCPTNDINSFAEAIIKLDKDRNLMKQFGENSKNFVLKNHNYQIQNIKYHELFYEIFIRQEDPKHHHSKMKIGSRLDNHFIPNKIVKIIRNFIKK